MKKLLSLGLTALLAVSLAACSSNAGTGAGESANEPAAGEAAQSPATAEAADSTAAGGVVEIPMLMRNAGNDASTAVQEFLVENFNKKFDGQYKIVVEWLPGVAEDIRAKLKMLNASSDLPAIVSDLGAEPAFADLLFKNNRLVDLKPYFDTDPEWQRVAIPESVTYNTIDGKMYSAPYASSDYIGIFYNKEQFQAAGVEAFPETWDDFWAACDKLKAAGYTPLSLHTTETGWCPMLLATSSFAGSDEGTSFIRAMYPTEYNQPAVLEMLEIVKRLFEYSTPDAVGGNYALAANNFCSEKTAMIPNGPWMIASLSDPQFASDGFEDKVGYAMYPGGTMISNLGDSYNEGVSVDQPEEVQQGAIEVLKFKASEEYIRFQGVQQGMFCTAVPLTEEDMAGFTPVMKEYAALVGDIQRTIPSYQGKWDPLTQNEVIPTELIPFIGGTITAEELADKMSEAAQKYEADSQNG